MKKISSLLTTLSISFSSFSQNADSTWFVNNYTKIEKFILMRGGVGLFTNENCPMLHTLF